MAETDRILDPDWDPQGEEVAVEDVHGHPVKVARKRASPSEDDPFVTPEEALQDQRVVLDAQGEYILDEVGNRIFEPFPPPEPTQR
jgi:hypothetical protein